MIPGGNFRGQIRWLLAVFFISTTASAQSVRWEPEFRFPGTFFPSFAISASGRDTRGPIDSPIGYGYVHSGSLAINLQEAPADALIKVEVEIPEIGVHGELEATAPTDGKAKILVPRLTWSQARLVSIVQPLSADAIFRIRLNGELVGEQKRAVRVRAINDAPLRACRSPQQCADFSSHLAAFVNEDHPVVDHVLRAALDIPAMPVKQWIGTQGNADDVLRQVWAIWYLLQRSKVTYSSITTTSDLRADVLSQTVRPLTQALRTGQANCIDGTVLFASILRKIGIEPIIVLVPGHAFLGFFTDATLREPVFLETTMLNSSTNPFNQRSPTQAGIELARALGTDLHMKRSWQSFSDAIKVGQQRFAEAQPHFGKRPGFTLVPIRAAREAGIVPLPL